MSNIFFEGFNSSNSDAVKLDPEYWSANDITKISFENGRTNSAVSLTSRNFTDSLSLNTLLVLSGVQQLNNNTAFGIGMYNKEYALMCASQSHFPSPYSEDYLSFYNENTEVLSVKINRTTYNNTGSIGFGIYQNGSLLTTYDLKSHVGHSWNIQIFSYNIGTVTSSSYFEMYVDPRLENKLAIRFSSSNTINAHLLNSDNEIYTSISGFNTITSGVFHGTHGFLGTNRLIDDLYIKSGSSLSGCLLGNNTKIYRLTTSNDGATQQWTGLQNGSTTNPSYWLINNNDGDSTLIYGSVSGQKSIYHMQDVSNPTPSSVAGIKLINVVRNNVLGASLGFRNIMTSGNDTADYPLGSGYNVSSVSYSYKNQFIYTNPVTGSGWTKDDINNLQLGVEII